jgi:hypothetical protein
LALCAANRGLIAFARIYSVLVGRDAATPVAHGRFSAHTVQVQLITVEQKVHQRIPVHVDERNGWKSTHGGS